MKGDKTKRSGENNLSSSGMSGVGKPLLEVDITKDSTTFNFALDGSGNLYVKSAGSGRWDFDRDVVVNVKGNRRTNISGQDKLVANELVLEARRHRATYDSSREKVGSKEIDGQVSLGFLSAPTAPAVRGGADFVKAFTTPGNFIAQIPSPTGKPIDAPVVPGPGLVAMLPHLVSSSVKVGR